MKFFYKIFFTSLILLLTSCIQEDLVNDAVPEQLRILNNTTQLNVDDVIVLNAAYFNEVGLQENRTLIWQSSNTDVLSVVGDELTAVAKGTASISVITTNKIGEELKDSKTIQVVQGAIVVPKATKIGSFVETSSYVAKGDIEIVETATGIQINLADNYRADTDLPGFAMYLTNNPNSLTNALQVDAFDDGDGTHYSGAFSYTIDGVGINDYAYLVHWCRPFAILVGQAAINDK